MYCRIYLPCVSIKLNKRLDLVLTFCGFVMPIRVLLSRFLSHPFLSSGSPVLHFITRKAEIVTLGSLCLAPGGYRGDFF